jgi:hypothetical protein
VTPAATRSSRSSSSTRSRAPGARSTFLADFIYAHLSIVPTAKVAPQPSRHLPPGHFPAPCETVTTVSARSKLQASDHEEGAMPGSMRRRGTSWELRAYAGTDPETGKRRWVTATTKGTRRAAERELAEFVARIDYPRRLTAEATVSRLLEDWYRAMSPNWSPTTARTDTERHRLPPRAGPRRRQATDASRRAHRRGAVGESVTPKSCRRVTDGSATCSAFSCSETLSHRARSARERRGEPVCSWQRLAGGPSKRQDQLA